MRREMRNKLKVFAVDGAMLFLAIQITIVGRDARKVGAATITRHNQVYAANAAVVAEPEKETEKEDSEEMVLSDKTVSLVRSRDWGSEDVDILMRIAMAEAEGEGAEGMAHVMMVVLNRVWTDEFPRSVGDVVFQEGQFSVVEYGGRYWSVEPDENCREAMQMLTQGWDESEGALYFCKADSENWITQNREYLYTVGNHSFYK